MTTSAIESVVLRPQPTAVVRAHVGIDGVAAFIGSAFGETIQAMTAQRLAPTGPPFARYGISDSGFDVEAGFPSAAPITPTGRVVAGELPGGPAAQVTYRGDYSGVAEAYEATASWIAEHGGIPDGDPWEVYLDEPTVPEPRTVVHMPYRPN